MVEYAESDAVVLAVFDGHGVAGHCVSQLLRDALPAALFASPCYTQFLPLADTIPPPGCAQEAQELASTLASGGGGGVGAKRAASAREPLPPTLCAPRLRRNVGGALVEALAAVEAELLARADIDCTLAGATACIVCVTDGDHLTVANVGDSRAMLLRRTTLLQGGPPRLRALSLSVDHKPSLPSEGKRILLAGGSIAPLHYEDGEDGPLRVWAPGISPPGPGLAVSRSLGDTMGKLAGVSAQPDVYTGTLHPGECAFLVVASDGLWEFMSGAAVAEVVEGAGERAGEEERDFAAAAAAAAEAGDGAELPPPRAQLQLALDELVEKAITKWREAEGSYDDIGIVLAEIGTA